jgi:hypothetical protein
MGASEFIVDVFQNEYLPGGAREVNAIVTVTSPGSAADTPATAAGAAEIIIVDRSSAGLRECAAAVGGWADGA